MQVSARCRARGAGGADLGALRPRRSSPGRCRIPASGEWFLRTVKLGAKRTGGVPAKMPRREGAVMRSAWSAFSMFGVVAGAAIVSSGIAGGLLGTGTAAGAATVNAAASKGCGQPPAATSAARSVPASQSAVVLDAAWLSPPKAGMARTGNSALASGTAMTTAAAEAVSSATATPEPTSSASATQVAALRLRLPRVRRLLQVAARQPVQLAAPRPVQVAAPRLRLPLPRVRRLRVQQALRPVRPRRATVLRSSFACRSGRSPLSRGCIPVGRPGYAIWVWPAGGAAGGVTVTISGKAGSEDVTPSFTVCASRQWAHLHGRRDRRRGLGRA